MKRFIEGLDRTQTTLLPDCVDDYVGQDNPVRASDAFVDMLDLGALGFDIEPDVTGRPGTTRQRCSRSTATCFAEGVPVKATASFEPSTQWPTIE